MEDNHNRRKLKNYFVLREVQIKIILVNTVHMLLVFLIMAGVVVLPLYLSLLQSPSVDSRYAQLFLFIMAEPLPLVMMIIVLLFIAHQTVITHQFCGPIVNFSKTFREIESGNLTRRVHLRKKDLLKKEAACINSMVDSLAQRIGGIRQEHAVLMLSLKNVRIDTQSPDARQQSEQALAAALGQAQALQARLDGFILEKDEQKLN